MSVVFKKKEMANNANKNGSEHEHKAPLLPHLKLVEYSDYRMEILRKRANLAKCSLDEVQELDVSRLGAKRQKSRAERLFDKMMEDDKKRKERETEMRAFKKTLHQSDKESNENGYDGNNGIAEMPLKSKMPSAKKPSASTTQEDWDKITVIPGSPIRSENLLNFLVSK